jgi:oxygen-independent coproporphyrinogen-3 oxidase
MLLYIHIPFCNSKCSYCSFNSYTNQNEQIEEYFDALIEQFLYDVDNLKIKKNSVETLYIGGGTPSVVGVEHYQKLFDILTPYLKIHSKKEIEITIEANPNLNKSGLKWLKDIRKYCNRISFGVQSFDSKKLKFLGRTHKVEDSIEAIRYASQVGFEKISIDFIYDTAIDTKELLANDLKIASSLPINHISAYSLIIEENSKFKNQFDKRVASDELGIWFINEIKNLGFTQYEIANFAKDDGRSLHNSSYWTGKEYLGIGAGAVGFVRDYRYSPHKNISKYIQNPTQYEIEKLSKDDKKLEKIFLGLRSDIGVQTSIFSQKELKNIEILLSQDKLIQKDDRIYNTNFLIADEIVLFI